MPPPQTKFIDSIVDAARQDERVRAIGLFGSHVSGEADEWSDVDLVVVVEREDALSTHEEQQRFAAAIDGYLVGWSQDYLPVEMWMLLYAPGLHVELKFVHWEKIPTLPHGLEIVWSRAPVDPTLKPEAPRWQQPDVQDLEDQVWIAMNYLRRKVGRGEYFEAASSLDFVRRKVLLPLLGARHQTHLAGYRRLEEQGWCEVDRLALTFAGPQPQDIERAMSVTVELYLELRESVAPPGLIRRVDAQRTATSDLKT